MMNRRRTRTVRIAVIALALAGAPASRACGVCVEDKIAATYDHAVLMRATAHGHVVVFAAVDGFTDADALAADARKSAKNVRGIDAGTVRAAVAPAALSFALDPGLQAPEAAMHAVERHARTPGFRLTLLKVVR